MKWILLRREQRRSVIAVASFAAAVAIAGCAPSRGAAFERALAEGRRAHHSGRFSDAADRFEEAARTASVPRDAIYARYEAALARAKAGDIARAHAELVALASEAPTNGYAAQASLKAAVLAFERDPKSGCGELEETLLRFPENGVARVALSRLIRHDDESGPRVTLAHLEALLPKVAGKTLEQDVAYERAKRLAELEQITDAREAYLDVARRWPYPKGPYFDDALYRASEMEEKLGRIPEAITHLERLLSFRESSVSMGSYERPRYVPAMLRIADLQARSLHDRRAARETLHKLYANFKTSRKRDDALWIEASLWEEDGNHGEACERLLTLAREFPESRYVPCAIERCPAIVRPQGSKPVRTCSLDKQEGGD
jgi:tetratricopeptide (TPR) repeat protein